MRQRIPVPEHTADVEGHVFRPHLKVTVVAVDSLERPTERVVEIINVEPAKRGVGTVDGFDPVQSGDDQRDVAPGRQKVPRSTEFEKVRAGVVRRVGPDAPAMLRVPKVARDNLASQRLRDDDDGTLRPLELTQGFFRRLPYRLLRFAVDAARFGAVV